MFLYIVEMVGAFAAAISGIRLASMKRFDWFGAYIVGLDRVSEAVGKASEYVARV